MSLKDKLPEIVDPGVITRSFQARESWRVFEIMAEFVESTERLQQIQPAISLFSSARTARDHPYYKLTEEISRLLSDSGFAVISGGGPGIMEAANKGRSTANRPRSGSTSSCRTSRTPTRIRTSARPSATFCPQGNVRQARYRLCGNAGRIRHAG